MKAICIIINNIPSYVNFRAGFELETGNGILDLRVGEFGWNPGARESESEREREIERKVET